MAGENKEEFRESKELLVALDDYKKAGIGLGTKVITSYMRRYVYKRRADGLATINTQETDSRLKLASSMMAEYSPDEIIVACKRESGWNAAKEFSKVTGIKVFTKKYPAGIITNTNLPDFFESSLLLIVDPWLDKNPMQDALKLNIPIISLCDTNNVTSNIDLVIPCNNKGEESLGLIFYILAAEYCKKRKIKADVKKENFVREAKE